MQKIKTVDIHEIFKDKDFISAVKCVIENKNASTAFLQRKFHWGYAKAADYIDYMINFGYVSNGVSNRKVLATIDVFKTDAKENFYLDV
ncbi:MAG: hypothetical protein IJA23_06710 [Clostridia bacterium]|nr:hypothetical protein [Clostridia bacterium]